MPEEDEVRVLALITITLIVSAAIGFLSTAFLISATAADEVGQQVPHVQLGEVPDEDQPRD